MGSISGTNAPRVSNIGCTEAAGVEQTSGLQLAYQEQCRKVLDKRDERRNRDDSNASHAPARKKAVSKGEPLVAAIWMYAPYQQQDRPIERFGRNTSDGAGATRADVTQKETFAPVVSSIADGRAGDTSNDATHVSHANVDRTVAPAHADPMAAHRTRDSVTLIPAEAMSSSFSRQPASALNAGTTPIVPASQNPRTAHEFVSQQAKSATGVMRAPNEHDSSVDANDVPLTGFARVSTQMPIRTTEPHIRTLEQSRATYRDAVADPANVSAQDMSETPVTQVRYSFNTWDGRPAVNLRFNLDHASQVVTAQPSQERVQHAMERGVDQLAPGWIVEFDRQQADDGGSHSSRRHARQESEADEQ
ncbi:MULTISPECIES: SpaN/EivJ family type III secretion system needle length determinant [Burkholderia]|uniref:SpaN/EivJ family type III secretion system needle length determinant n=1 Tax=Burkholderia TaxID=32008 RepID=UPI0007C69697|nr:MULTISPECIES: hypothetical protein [Burkholderia]